MHYAKRNRCEYVGRTQSGAIKRCRRRAGPESPYCGHHRQQARRDDQLFQLDLVATAAELGRRRWRLATMVVSSVLVVSVILGVLF
jgi:hypothetical protein